MTFEEIEQELWRRADRVHPMYERRRYDGWVMCPREHAITRLRCIVEIQPLGELTLQSIKDAFRQRQRYFPGVDHVFAVGDRQ